MNYSIVRLIIFFVVLLLPIIIVEASSVEAMAQLEQEAEAIEEIDAAEQLVEAERLFLQGLQQYQVSQFQEALQSWQQALDLYQNPTVRAVFSQESYRGEGAVLGNLGNIYLRLGQYQQANDFYEQVLEIFLEIGDRAGQGSVLGNLGDIQLIWGQYQHALRLYEQHLTITREISDHAGEGAVLGDLGNTYFILGQYQKALGLYEQQLAITREIGDRAGEGSVLGNLGNVYFSLEQPQQAIDLYKQMLVITREIGDRAEEGRALGNLGSVHSSLGQYQQALDSSNQRLAIAREIGDRAGEGFALGALGKTYFYMGGYQQALEAYQQALAIVQEIGDRAGEGLFLSQIGMFFAEQEQSELAIIFYKQSVNLREKIREDLQGLEPELQQSFTDTIADDYRTLADLLLQQDRILEAQQVLDLLKVQELDDYLQNIHRTPKTQPSIDTLPPETELLNEYNARLSRVIALGQQLQSIRKTNQRTFAQEQQRREIEAEQQQLLREFLDFINTRQVQEIVAQLRQSTESRSLEPNQLRSLQDDLLAIGSDTVLLYPLVLNDRLELVLVTPYTPPVRRPVGVTKNELNEVIMAFRQALDTPGSDVEPLAQQLYDWLIRPLSAALQEAKAKTIIYAPDGQLRYIPLAALHDGHQWLTEQYQVNHITSLSLVSWDDRPQVPKILAGAFGSSHQIVDVAGDQLNFAGLPYTIDEVQTLVDTMDNTTILQDSAFSRSEIEALMSDYSILHLATHAAFVVGEPSESFILFGDGDRATFRDVELWPLAHTDLVVLSACETGVGGIRDGDGREILGFGYLMQEAGAAAAIASLWQVSDGGTQTLMNAFYRALKNGYSKTESLQRAQQALITRDESVLDVQRNATIEVIDTRTRQALSQRDDLSHPYYWAPFILIGNGL